MSNFVENYEDFESKLNVDEATEEAEKNVRIKELMTSAKEAKQKALDAKEKYDAHIENGEEEEAEVELLRFKKYKAQAEMQAADSKLMVKGEEKE